MAYDAALILQKKHRAKTNFIYSDFATIPRPNAEHGGKVRYNLIPKDIMDVSGSALLPLTESKQPERVRRGQPPQAAQGAPGGQVLPHATDPSSCRACPAGLP